MAKLKPNEKRAQLSFVRPEDQRLYAFLEKRAYENRWDIGTLILMSLHEAFKGQIEDAELDALAEEAARKVRERAAPPAEPQQVLDALTPPTATEAPAPLSDDEAYRQGQEHVARMNAMAPQVFAGKKKGGGRKGVPGPPPLPE
jgi:hypothetical protein